MARQELRDRNDVVVGTIEQKADGIYEGRDRNGVLKGTYDPKTNVTRDRDGRTVGRGNLLSNLIFGR